MASSLVILPAAEVETMRAFFAAVLSVIAVGVMLIAYGLLNPRTPSAEAFVYPYPGARPMLASQRVGMVDQYGYVPNSPYGYTSERPALAYPASDVRALPQDESYPAPRRVATQRVATRTVPARAERSSGRDWQKTAMVIGGTTAAGAGLGAIFGGKKGALIGAAIGGGAGTLYEVKKR
jgi:hypothetical protein